jgi:hypothetical protein
MLIGQGIIFRKGNCDRVLDQEQRFSGLDVGECAQSSALAVT